MGHILYFYFYFWWNVSSDDPASEMYSGKKKIISLTKTFFKKNKYKNVYQLIVINFKPHNLNWTLVFSIIIAIKR